MRDIFITSSILILAILLIRTLLKGRINPCIQYALWLLVVIRLILPMPLWNSRLSVMNLFPETVYEGMADSDNFAGAGDIAGAGNLTGVDNISDRFNEADIANRTDSASADGRSEMNSLANAFNGIGAANIAGAADRINTDNAAGAANENDTDSLADSSKTSAAALSGESAQTSVDTSVLPKSAKTAPAFDIINNAAYIKVFALIQKWLPLIWIIGMAMTGGYMLYYQIKWKRYLYANRKPFPEMGKYKDTLSVYTVEKLPSPCLSGRCIYLTKEMAKDKEELIHILAHEYCHYRQLDSLWVIVRCLLTVIYWFNPLVWMAAYISKLDSELACDEAAIRLLGEKERLAYGKTLIKLVSGDRHICDRIGIASTMGGGEKSIKERILIIAKKPKYLVTAAAAVAVIAAALIAFTFSGAGNKNEDLAVTDEAYTAEPEGRKETEKELKIKQAELEVLENELVTRQAELEALEVELELSKATKEEAALAAKEDALMKEINSLNYDENIILAARKDGIADIKNPTDYYQCYVNQGEGALDEGVYKLMEIKDKESSGIVVYGIYTKEFGCNGIKILIGKDIYTYPLKWKPALLSGIGKNTIRIYEKAQDKEARPFAFKLPGISDSTSEVWDLYVCDRNDNGTLTPYQFMKADYLKLAKERLSFMMETSEEKVYVYDNGKSIGTIDISKAMELASFMADKGADSNKSIGKISEVVVDDNVIDWELGGSEDEIRLFMSIGLKIDGIDELWHRGLNMLSFAVDVERGINGECVFTLGKARIENHVNEKVQMVSLKSSDIAYINPCPSYSRISDGFGSRLNPITGETITHSGIDFVAENGADIVAAADGQVTETGYDSDNGNYVTLYHPNGEYTHYNHCDEILVSEEDEVKAGEKIATVGSSGRSTGAHLHFALSRNGEYVEPVFQE